MHSFIKFNSILSYCTTSKFILISKLSSLKSLNNSFLNLSLSLSLSFHLSTAIISHSSQYRPSSLMCTISTNRERPINSNTSALSNDHWWVSNIPLFMLWCHILLSWKNTDFQQSLILSSSSLFILKNSLTNAMLCQAPVPI